MTPGRESERERNGVENGDRQKVTRTATNDPLSNERGKKLKMKKKLENFNMMMHSTPLDTEVLALKHESRIRGPWSNAVSGSRMSHASSP